MKDDTISRAAALSALADYIHNVDRVMGDGHLSADDCMDAARSVLGEDELPSAQPECEDAVSRFEVLRLIDYSSNDLNDSVDNWYFQGKVKELPSVTPKQPGWIPVTEKPIEGGQYIVTLKDDKEVWTDIAEWNPTFGGRWQAEFFDCEYRDIDNVVAWMPLPKPWEGDTDAH